MTLPGEPYTLRWAGACWLLVDTETGEVEDEFTDYETALETLRDQNS